MNNIERDIIKNSEYVISYFNSENKTVTNLKLQKLMYFLEAIYMFYTKETFLYEEEFCAWNFGPVNEELYRHYKNFMNLPINLENKENIPIENKKYVEILYDTFGEYSAYELVVFSHESQSPWSKINEKYKGNIPKNEIIKKDETLKWFEGLVENE